MAGPDASETGHFNALHYHETYAKQEQMLTPELEGLLTLLSDDERPTFIIGASSSLHVVYRNASFLSLVATDPSLENWVAALSSDPIQSDGSSKVRTAGCLGGREWLSKRVGDFYIIYRSSEHIESEQQESNGPSISREAVPHNKSRKSFGKDSHNILDQKWGQHGLERPNAPVSNYNSDNISEWFFDWLRYPMNTTDPWARFLQEYDWDKTAIGPIATWPHDLCRLVIYIFSAPDPRLILWGDSLLCIFNAAAKDILGERYLACLGNPLEHGLGGSVVKTDLACLRRTVKNGKAIKEADLEYYLNRHGFLEIGYFDCHIAPVPGENGYLVGAVIEFQDTTHSIVVRRRQLIASSIFENITQIRDEKTLWSSLLKTLVTQPKYISYAVIYTKDDTLSHGQYQLHGSEGAGDVHLSTTLDIGTDCAPSTLAAAVKSAATTPYRIHVSGSPSEAPPQPLAIPLAEGGTVTTVCILPIDSGTSTIEPPAFIILGMNPFIQFNDDDKFVLGRFRDIISKACASIRSPKNNSNQELWSLNQDLALKLQISTSKVKKSEENFSRMARNAPFGMYIFDSDGTAVFLNDTWFNMSGFQDRADFDRVSAGGYFWRDKIPGSDHDNMLSAWKTALTSRTPHKHEHRVIIPGTEAEPRYRWVEATSFPEFDQDDNIIAIRGWLVDVDNRRLAEDLMSQQLEDALESKRASERFIDMNIRNPLSAILQSADGILTSLETPESSAAAVAESTIDAARTIILCASHQKRIVDDVLILSKLDSNLLVVSPDRCRPPELVQKALKMYESELAPAGIQVSVKIQQSYKDLEIEAVLLDESRILQVVMNLLGNAIKFTSDSETREIVIGLAASREPFTGEEYGIKFATPRATRPKSKRTSSSALAPESSRDDVYLGLAVTDTGRGLTQDEIDRLFQRFSQASPKTYKKYGGNGLGLYISKELTELQGGRIGVKSKGKGKGSTFAFYVKTSRTEAPPLLPSIDASISKTDVLPVELPDKHLRVDSMITEATKVNESETSMRALHVLVVEDNAINQKVMAQQLRRNGHTVHLADQGVEALDFLATTDFQGASVPLAIVLMDIEMPVMNGLDCTRRIRQLEDTGVIKRRVPIIAITANARNGQIANALEAGVDEVVTKPFRIPELLPKMETLVEKLLGQIERQCIPDAD